MNDFLGNQFQLHNIASGRLFVRSVRAESANYNSTPLLSDRMSNAVMIIGVVEVPKFADVERNHSVRINDHMWMDIENARPVNSDWTSRRDFREFDIGDILIKCKFSVGVLPDSLEVFLRSTMIEHNTPCMRWAYVAGPSVNRLAAMPVDGLYEFDSVNNGFRMVSDNPYIGETATSILRKPIWGPGGRFGMSTSMEPEHFPKWLKADRAQKSNNRDPYFNEYAKLMLERAPERHVYTADQKAEYEALSKAVLKEVMAADRELKGASPAPVAARPRP